MNEIMNMTQEPVLFIVLTVLVFFFVALGMYKYLKRKNIEEIRSDVYKLVLRAEHVYKESDSGKQKMKWVVSQARRLLPGWLQVIISEEALEKIIQIWFDERSVGRWQSERIPEMNTAEADFL